MLVARPAGMGRSKTPKGHPPDAGDAHGPRRRARQVDDPALHERPSIGDPHRHRAARRPIGDANPRAHRIEAMSRGEATAPRVPSVVPGRQSATPSSSEAATMPVTARMVGEPRHVPPQVVSTVPIAVDRPPPMLEPEPAVSAVRAMSMMPDMMDAAGVVPVNVSPVTRLARVGIAANERQTQHEHEQMDQPPHRRSSSFRSCGTDIGARWSGSVPLYSRSDGRDHPAVQATPRDGASAETRRPVPPRLDRHMSPEGRTDRREINLQTPSTRPKDVAHR